MRNWKSLIVFLFLVALAAVSGAVALPDAWYAALVKPWFNPPNWVFPPAWTLLYILMAVAAWRVYRIAGPGREIGFWIAQLVFNTAWPVLFFRLHRITWAMVDIVLLLALILTTTVLFWRRGRTHAAVPGLGQFCHAVDCCDLALEPGLTPRVSSNTDKAKSIEIVSGVCVRPILSAIQRANSALWRVKSSNPLPRI
jgi:tryptophan-rich sensory protein